MYNAAEQKTFQHCTILQSFDLVKRFQALYLTIIVPQRVSLAFNNQNLLESSRKGSVFGDVHSPGDHFICVSVQLLAETSLISHLLLT